MSKTSRRNKPKGRVDRIRDWLTGTTGRLTGRSSQKVRGKATGKRGSFRTRKGQAKQRAGRRA
jgi:uncharacterized protein YjbJ (UPF0337 family)